MSLGLAGAQDVELTLETVIQTLESSVLCQEKGLGTRDLAQDAQTTSLPARIREIVTRNLSRPDSPVPLPAMEMASLLSLQEENQLLQQELSRVEDLLAQSRAERDELAIKYNAVSERGPAAAGRGAGPDIMSCPGGRPGTDHGPAAGREPDRGSPGEAGPARGAAAGQDAP
ncbi:rootletin-like [Macaca mulatta]